MPAAVAVAIAVSWVRLYWLDSARVTVDPNRDAIAFAWTWPVASSDGSLPMPVVSAWRTTWTTTADAASRGVGGASSPPQPAANATSRTQRETMRRSIENGLPPP